MKTTNIQIHNALRDPSSVFSSPNEVVNASGLNRDQKLKILRHWEFDCRELLVAEDENMGGGESARLQQVLHAIARLRVHARDLAG